MDSKLLLKHLRLNPDASTHDLGPALNFSYTWIRTMADNLVNAGAIDKVTFRRRVSYKVSRAFLRNVPLAVVFNRNVNAKVVVHYTTVLASTRNHNETMAAKANAFVPVLFAQLLAIGAQYHHINTVTSKDTNAYVDQVETLQGRLRVLKLLALQHSKSLESVSEMLMDVHNDPDAWDLQMLANHFNVAYDSAGDQLPTLADLNTVINDPLANTDPSL